MKQSADIHVKCVPLAALKPALSAEGSFEFLARLTTRMRESCMQNGLLKTSSQCQGQQRVESITDYLQYSSQ